MQAFFIPTLSPTDWKPMARKTNYGFERREREKARAAKKAERQRAKQEKSDDRKDDDDPSVTVDGETPEATESTAESTDDSTHTGS
ncbi:MAG: hypothetical protein ACI9JL_004035 [Paracoccaceae bacterium]|jgi:hypothetical protein